MPPLPEPHRATFVEVNRTRLRIWEWGDEADPVVFCLHGGFDHGRMYDGLAPEVAALGYHVRVLDLRAHGDSGRVAHGHTFDASIADLGALMVATPDPVGLIGHSMGSSMCLQAAATWPEHVRWVVSLDGLGPPAIAFESPGLAQDATGRLERTIRSFGRSIRVFPTRDELKEQRAKMNTRLPAAWLEHMVQHGAFEHEGGWAWKWDPLSNTSVPDGFREEWVTEDFSQVVCPVLALTGAEDDLWSEMTMDEVQARLALFVDHEHHRIGGAGHYPHLEQPTVVYQHVRSFLERQVQQ